MKKRYCTDEIVPESGIYYVFHEEHRLIHTVRLHSRDRFPRCSQCKEQVRFELMLHVPDRPSELPIHLFEVGLQSETEDPER
jgi:hypothetical protein